MISIPSKSRFRKVLNGNSITQLTFPASEWEDNAIRDGQSIEINGKKIWISAHNKKHIPAGFDDALFVIDGKPRWSSTGKIEKPKWKDLFSLRDEVILKVGGRLKLIEEIQASADSPHRPGFRKPQIGAIHSVLGHWGCSESPATVVLPTGTGKTDCMVALAALQTSPCVLVVVPTDALRTQIADKFLSHGVLLANGLLPPDVPYPLVGVLETGLKSESEVKTFCNACNVVVTTVPLLRGFTEAQLAMLASHCGILFIDEAHHVKAPTWERLKGSFQNNRILQFTATPYRNDGKHIDGKLIFDYPLRKAQAEGYFTKIILRELWEVVDGDEEIAKTAIEVLKADLETGFDHLVMVRAKGIDKAEGLKSIYSGLAESFNPVVVHSKLTSKEVSACLEDLKTRKSRIAICVNMFGEGFDFPELKIAALHDIHQSLSVTIQFTGRFARSKSSVGPATIIVNRASAEVDESVSALYSATGGADWNSVLTELTSTENTKQNEKQTFFDSFPSKDGTVHIQNVRPKMSTVVFKTNCVKWNPFALKKLPIYRHRYGDLNVSVKEDTAYLVTVTDTPVDWAARSKLTDRAFDLYLFYWDSKSNLLYINSSNNDSVHEELANAVCEPETNLISGLDCFRVLHGMKSLLLRNMGLNDRLRRSVRFVMYSGADIRAYLESANNFGTQKTHVFGDGYNGKKRITVGTSKKGRIWSWQEAKDILDWKQWCREVGAKVTDSSIKHDSFMQEMLVPKDISSPPDLFPLTVDWPDELYRRDEESILLSNGAVSVPFFEASLELFEPQPASALSFTVETEQFSARYELHFDKDGVSYHPDNDLIISLGKRRMLLSDYFAKAHPIVIYEKDCWSRGDQLFELLERTLSNFDVDKIATWDWTGVDLKKESQKIQKRPDSIQRRTIETISKADWDRTYDIIFDDDSSGEAADVVGLAIDEATLYIDLFHCKYTKPKSGKRLDDLYVVCGQSIRSVKQADDVDRFFRHLMNRERERLKKHKVSRFERGDFKELSRLRALARTVRAEFRVFIVQPGLKKSVITADLRDLLGSTELYLNTLRGIKLKVIGS